MGASRRSVRRWLIAVAVLGVLAADVTLSLRRRHFLATAEHHRRGVELFTGNDASLILAIRGQQRSNAMWERELAQVEKQRDAETTESGRARGEERAKCSVPTSITAGKWPKESKRTSRNTLPRGAIFRP